ncbi:alpha/beta-Hydrolases superfamily protein [Rhynchospora pubera]|uniref:Alpha/beta-Hydrolases superfamily protein n=1 Tax=Rhynchospora pubera TaxID=906938 RepID=A0AAV8CZB4_9POAL|nr:alpha/beta-Hydrolases superfamily protein [Rhynchospora pubera]KAJ4813463.1 alpha/beta-Hydrolases superfamily protein [Rhynchospora pubera]
MDEVIYKIENVIKIYNSGRVERFVATQIVPPSTDPTTGVSSKDVTITPNVSARLYLPKLDADKKVPVLVYYHGGAFCIGSAFDIPWHSYATALAAKANVIIISVQYRLAPEHPVPIAYQDSYAAFDWVISHADGGSEHLLANHGDLNRLFILGESAGANIVHHVAMYGGAKIRGALLLHPYFLSSKEVESEKKDPVAAENLKSIWKIVCPKTSGLDDPLINPLSEAAPPLGKLGCERILITVAEMDALNGRGRAYYEKLKESEWKGEVKIWEAVGEGHCFFLGNPVSEMALEQDEIIAEFLNKE